MNRRPIACLLVVVLVALLGGCGTVRNTVRDGTDQRLMLRGNDPVAYFTRGMALVGDPAIKAEHEGVTYRFVSEANRAAFLKEPARYEPAYAGFCASGAPYALKANVGAQVFIVYRDRLYLFGSERSRRGWLLDIERNIEIGDRYWADETRDMPHRIQNWKRYLFKVPHYRTDAELDAEYEQRKQAGTLPALLR